MKFSPSTVRSATFVIIALIGTGAIALGALTILDVGKSLLPAPVESNPEFFNIALNLERANRDVDVFKITDDGNELVVSIHVPTYGGLSDAETDELWKRFDVLFAYATKHEVFWSVEFYKSLEITMVGGEEVIVYAAFARVTCGANVVANWDGQNAHRLAVENCAVQPQTNLVGPMTDKTLIGR